MVDNQGPQPEIKREQEAYPPQLPDNPEALETEKRNVIGVNVLAVSAVFVIMIVILLIIIL